MNTFEEDEDGLWELEKIGRRTLRRLVKPKIVPKKAAPKKKAAKKAKK